MKLILTQEVSGLGAPGDVVEVKDGYGRNYLVPRKLATPWTKGGQSQVDAIQRARASREHSTLDGAVAARDRLQGSPVQLVKRAGANGRLFGAVTPADIAEAIAAAGGPAVDRRTVVLARPIKSLGSHNVTIRLHPEVTASVEIDVFDPDAPVSTDASDDDLDAAGGGTGFVKRATPAEPLPDEDFLSGTASEEDDAAESDADDAEAEYEDTYGDEASADDEDAAGTPATTATA